MNTATKRPESLGGSGGGGRRLSAAFDTVDTLPALSETVSRISRPRGRQGVTTTDLAEAIESDAAVTIAVMRAANNTGRPRGSIAGEPSAIEALGPERTHQVVGELETYQLFQSAGAWGQLAERFRRHAVATRHAAERVAELGGVPRSDELVATALMHDVGQLVLTRLYPGYATLVDDRSLTPEERAKRDRRELGIDHTLVGGVLARRWGLPSLIASAIERHHSEQAAGMTAALRLGDLIAHHSQGELVSGRAMEAMALACGLRNERLTQIIYEFPHTRAPRKRRAEPCPLSKCEIDALRGLAEGKVYKRSRPRWASRQARCGPTCTTSTARSARRIERKRCSWPVSAIGSR